MSAGRTVTGAGGIRAEVLGEGTPLLALHGAYSTRGEVRGFLEPAIGTHRDGLRRIYPDLPGMGESPGGGFDSSADVVQALADLLEAEAGPTPAYLVGHSFGAHLARGLAALRPERVRGLALLCPLVPDDQVAEPAHTVAEDPSDTERILPDPAQRAEFEGYFVVRTAAMAARFREAVAPSLGRFEAESVERLMTRSRLHPDPSATPYAGPTLVMVARHDSWAGYRQHTALVECYPRATGMVVADAGHALPHERPALLAGALEDWLARA